MRRSHEGAVSRTENKDLAKQGSGWTALTLRHVLALLLDLGFVFSLYTYYAVISSFSATSIETLVRGAGEGLAMQAKSIILAILLFLILPTCIYSLFKSLKIPVLATGGVGATPRPFGLFLMNLGFLFISFILYSVFELLGATVQEAYIPLVAGSFLGLTMAWLGVVVCVSHRNLYRTKQAPLRSALMDWAALKRGFWFSVAGIGVLVVFNLGAYVLASPGSDKPLEYLAYLIGALLFVLVNQFQIGLYIPAPSKPPTLSTTK